MSCLMYGRRTSAVFSTSATLRICRPSVRIAEPLTEVFATYVNRPEASAMTGSHVLVQRVDRIRPRQFPIFFVHVVRA